MARPRRRAGSRHPRAIWPSARGARRPARSDPAPRGPGCRGPPVERGSEGSTPARSAASSREYQVTRPAYCGWVLGGSGIARPSDQLARRRSDHGVPLALTWRCAAVVVALAIIGCTSSGQGSSPASPNPSPTSSPSPSEAEGYVRSCGTDVSGDLGPMAKWLRSSAVVGPFALGVDPELHRCPRSRVQQPASRRQGASTREAGAPSRPRGPKRRASRRDAHLRPQQGNELPRRGPDRDVPGVPLWTCHYGNDSWTGATQFNGGIFVAEPMCLKLLVSTRAEQNKAVYVPFGLHRSRCP